MAAGFAKAYWVMQFFEEQVLGGLAGYLIMTPYFSYANETAALHGRGYNILFADGHVALVKRSDHLFPPRTARNWNRDNQPHPEAWAPANQWVVQQ
jgi:prepilin-type processing-associated H-X9-DG protein